MNNHVYLRKLLTNELGIRRGSGQKAGRFILISKEACGAFFPALSETITNDYVMLNVIPPENEKDIVLTTFKYHNDKKTKNKSGGRDEYRLYLNTENDPERDYFKPDDIVVFWSEEVNGDTVYRMVKYSAQKEPEIYKRLEDILERNPIGRSNSHSLVPSNTVDFLGVDISTEAKYERKRKMPSEVEKDIFSLPVIDDQREDKEQEFTERVRTGSFRDFVLLFYNFQCAITGKKFLINYKNISNLEAAHLRAFASKGGSNPSNGIPLIRDLHWAFDEGSFSIDDDYKIIIHPEAEMTPFLGHIKGKTLILPADPRAYPNEESLKWHRKNVFGKFTRK